MIILLFILSKLLFYFVLYLSCFHFFYICHNFLMFLITYTLVKILVRHMLMKRLVPEIGHYLEDVGLLRVATIGTISTHTELINMLVERWKPETHTFHLPIGECTITLEDVAILLGLRTYGQVVSGFMNFNFQLIEEYWENLIHVHPIWGKIDRSKSSWSGLTRVLEFSNLIPMIMQFATMLAGIFYSCWASEFFMTRLV